MRKLAVVASFALILGGVAYAAIPDAGGVIHGCYRTANPAKGALTVVDSEAGGVCPSGTAELNWNQTGPQGATGATGSQGPAGPSGISGYQVVTANRTYSPPQPGVPYGVEGHGIDAPAGKVTLSWGFYYDNNGQYPPPLIAFAIPNGSGYTIGLICQAPTPCEVVLYLIVADGA